jgi:hypothetical protein
MVVCVDDPGDNHVVGTVDCPRVRGHWQAAPHPRDLAILDEHVGPAEPLRVRRWLDEGTVPQEQSAHAASSSIMQLLVRTPCSYHIRSMPESRDGAPDREARYSGYPVGTVENLTRGAEVVVTATVAAGGRGVKDCR